VATSPNKIQSGQDAINIVRARTDTILLAFSLGKDSIAAWLECRKHFPRVIPFYLWSVPQLEFAEANLRYFETFFGTRIHRLPHPRIYRMLRTHVFQRPQDWPIAVAARLPAFDYDRQEALFREELGLGDEVYTATGVRSADSITRRVAIQQHGAVSHARKKFYPVHDWKKQRMVEEFQACGVKLPTDYAADMFGRSFDGINYQFLEPMRRRYPRDYARVLEFFPLAEVEMQRMDYAAQK
jgi:hypothetical protein